jgi:hypothetical protein
MSYAARNVHKYGGHSPRVRSNLQSIGIGCRSLFCGQFGPIKIASFRRLICKWNTWRQKVDSDTFNWLITGSCPLHCSNYCHFESVPHAVTATRHVSDPLNHELQAFRIIQPSVANRGLANRGIRASTVGICVEPEYLVSVSAFMNFCPNRKQVREWRLVTSWMWRRVVWCVTAKLNGVTSQKTLPLTVTAARARPTHIRKAVAG